MNRSIGPLLLAFCLSIGFAEDSDFKSAQRKFPRVRSAYAEKETVLKGILKKAGVRARAFDLFIRIFKAEGILETWVREKGRNEYVHLTDYHICNLSGGPGPKRKQGDGQVPEGFYSVVGFNPNSNFWLSLKVNYPNQSDRILGERGNLGGDIFIHGNCVTVRCIPITDDQIKELYILAVEAKNSGQRRIPIHLFPAKLTDESLASLKKEYAADGTLTGFWANLKQGYDYFETTKKLPSVSVDAKGKYYYR